VSFANAEEAALVADTKRREVYGDHIKLNFPINEQDDAA
jgi:hypothetical protein